MKKLIVLCLLLAAIFSFSGCQKGNTCSPKESPSTTPSKNAEIISLLKKGDYRQTIDACKAAEKDPEADREIFLAMAYAYLLDGRPDEAKSALKRWKQSRKTSPKNEEAKTRESFIVSMVEGRYDQALKEAEKLEKLTGISPAPEKGFAYYYKGELNRAAEIFEEIEENKKVNEWDRDMAGKMVDKIEKAEKSRPSGKKPESSPPPENSRKRKPSRKKRAESSLFTPIPRDKPVKGSDYTLLKKGDAFFTSGKFDEALKLYQKALEENPKNDDAYIRTGDIYLRTARYEKSGEAFEKALKVNPRNKYAHFGYADILMENGNYKRAEQHLKKALEIDPGFAVAYTTIGDIYVDRDDYREAEKAFLRSLEADPRQKYPDTYIGLGELYFKQDKLAKSLEYFKIAQEKDPFDKDVFLGAAKTLIRMERYEEAEANFEKALHLVPGDIDLGTEYIGFCIGTKRYEKAEKLLKTFLEKYPGEDDLLKLKEKLEETKP